jgi:NAD(P)-binding Rossmann-like domain/Phage integrase family
MERMVETIDTLIIGAGPAGLTTAYQLAKAGHDVAVIEQDKDYVGGISRTVFYKGFLFDIGGHRFFSKSREVVALWNEILPDDFLTRPRLSRIYYGGNFYAYPLKAFEALRNLGLWQSAACLASYAYARAFPIQNPKTFHQWMRNEFGERLFSIFFKTYTEKVWGMDCDEISADWAAQRIKGLNFFKALTDGLQRARNKAAECRALIARGIDPLAARKAASATSKAQTFGQCADDLIRSKRSSWRSDIHAKQWVTTITDYCAPIRDMPVDKIDTALVLSVLKPIWSRIPETASRLRGRIENVLDAARARGLIPADKANPARWRGHLEHLLSRPQKLARKHFAAMPYADIPGFLSKLHEINSVPALALEFLILTASRSGEVRGALWSEIDFETKIWTIPGERMKAGIAHRVPLSSRAMAILEHLS